MTADEYDTGEGPSPTNRTPSGDLVVGGDAGSFGPIDPLSERLDADRIDSEVSVHD